MANRISVLVALEGADEGLKRDHVRRAQLGRVADDYDDPGCSGGNTERPALKRLLADIGERIRDKIAAAKKKGLWMGGVPTLGYDVVNRQLVVNETEAAVVRRIFEEMLTIGSPTQIAAALTAEGITTKAWTTQEGRERSGARIDNKYPHKLLRNRPPLNPCR